MSPPSPLPTLPPSFPIHWRGDLYYEHARIGRVFNHRRPDRYPLAVVEAKHEEHIVEAVKLANKLECRVSVRSGGHSWAAWSVRDDAILIDLGKYYELSYDAETHVAKVSPSITGRMLNTLLGHHGRLFPGGHCPDVGVGGFALQGGMGWNCKNWGWACERVLGVDVVTANGELVHCDKYENTDLYFAARGAGPGFPGIVTRFYLQTLPVFSCMRSAAYFYKKEDYRKAVSWITKLAEDYDQDTEIVAVSSFPGGGDELRVMVLLVTFKNSEEEARKALQVAEDSHPTGNVDGWFMKPTSLQSEYDDQAAANPEGHRYCVDNAYIDNDANVVSVMEKAFTTLPTKKSFTLWYSMAPCSRRPLPDMALSMQSDHYLALYTVWEHKHDDAGNRGWVQNIMQDVEKQSVGAYLGDSDFQVRQTRFWGQEQGQRLMKIRKERDPQGRICGFLDARDNSGADGLPNEHHWLQ
ncbi:hypothetical protein SEUCBS140593_008982 [Sporothrix eucalyptigena]|uniref:FAD-binding PCMH-type domain-containing protein n=1 Tax=Sporothrix eucalyptigena TaxID=1812306 RepID=A0ABP0CR05_9PEZI